jgi:RNA polymerase sigma-70 factor (ECF subfamily)
VERCRQGDARSFEELFDRHRPSVARIVFRMTGPAGDVEDLVQEVFLQVIRSLDGFQRKARFSTWLYRVTVNVVLMHRRSLGRRPRLVAEDLAPPPLDPAVSVDEVIDGRARVDALYALLGQLSDKKRTVFVLHEIEGLSPARIGEIVRAPVLTVRTRLFYARREIARLIADDPALRDLLRELAAGEPSGGSRDSGGRGEGSA